MSQVPVIFSIIASTISILGLIFAWYQWRTKELRREEVLKWADECIDCLESLYLISCLDDTEIDRESVKEIRVKCMFRSSTLVERGRMFFKNEVIDDFGSEKPSAYCGYRPQILDHLVIAHQIARHWPSDDTETILGRTAVAKDCLNNFVSLAQKEVGRQRAASVEALKGGQGVNLNSLIQASINKKYL
jgi:hypothetical protein